MVNPFFGFDQLRIENLNRLYGVIMDKIIGTETEMTEIDIKFVNGYVINHSPLNNLIHSCNKLKISSLF